MTKIAVIDLGSNTTKLLIGRLLPDQLIETNFQKSIPCRIATTLNGNQDSILSTPEIERIVDVVQELLDDAVSNVSDQIFLVGTEALRKAENITLLQSKIQSETGLNLVVLSGKEEATAIAHGLSTDPNIRQLKDFYAFDLGGGSLELIKFSQSGLHSFHSLPLGSVTLCNKFIKNPHAPLQAKEAKNLRIFIADEIRKKFDSEINCKALVGCGGSLVHARMLFPGRNKAILPRSYFEELSSRVCSLNYEERRIQYKELPADRLDIIPTALQTILEIFDIMGVSQLTHSFHNLRYGIISLSRLSSKGENLKTILRNG